jgi:diguanylate cyclase (GGDEF)-like protein
MWQKWRETPDGLWAASHAGECQQRRNNAGEIRDPLTRIDLKGLMLARLMNRFNLIAEHPIRKSEQQKDSNGKMVSPGLFTFIDGDGFGDFNKTHNQEVGDEAICSLGKIIVNTTRAGDYIGRIGGDEFVTAMFGFSRDDAVGKMLRMRHALRQGGSTEHVDWTATIVGAYIEDPRDARQVEETHNYLSGVLGDWKKGDRLTEPPLLFEIQPDQEPFRLA